MNEQTELLREMRDLLRVIAEPALAKRDEKLRAGLRQLAGRGKTNTNAILLMDGTRTRADIRKQSGIDSGNLSRLEQSLRKNGLVIGDERPKLVINIPKDFFETKKDQ